MENSDGDGVIVNTTRITVPSENRKELCQTISSLLDPIRREFGCLTYRFYLEVGDANSIVLIGEWQSRTDWDNHLQSDNFAILLGSIMILSGRSNIHLKLLSHMAGLETLTRERIWSHG